MLLIIATVIALGLFIAMAVIADKHYWDDGWELLAWLMIFLSGCMLLGLLIWLSLLSVSIKSTKADYEVLSVQVEYVRNEGIVTDATLLEKILNMNSTIEHHRVFKDSPWLGWFHSEEIANLQPLKLPPND